MGEGNQLGGGSGMESGVAVVKKRSGDAGGDAGRGRIKSEMPQTGFRGTSAREE